MPAAPFVTLTFEPAIPFMLLLGWSRHGTVANAGYPTLMHTIDWSSHSPYCDTVARRSTASSSPATMCSTVGQLAADGLHDRCQVGDDAVDLRAVVAKDLGEMAVVVGEFDRRLVEHVDVVVERLRDQYEVVEHLADLAVAVADGGGDGVDVLDEPTDRLVALTERCGDLRQRVERLTELRLVAVERADDRVEELVDLRRARWPRRSDRGG